MTATKIKECDTKYDWSHYTIGILSLYSERASENVEHYQKLLDLSQQDLNAVQKELRRRRK